MSASDDEAGPVLLPHVGVEHESLGIRLVAVGTLEGTLDAVDGAEVGDEPVHVDETLAAEVAHAVAVFRAA